MIVEIEELVVAVDHTVVGGQEAEEVALVAWFDEIVDSECQKWIDRRQKGE